MAKAVWKESFPECFDDGAGPRTVVVVSLTSPELELLRQVLARIGGNPAPGHPRAVLDGLFHELKGHERARSREESGIWADGRIDLANYDPRVHDPKGRSYAHGVKR